MKRFCSLLLFLALSVSPAFSQMESGNGNKEGFRQTVVALTNRLVDYLEKIELSGVDTTYIGAPKKKWAVFANTSVSGLDFDLRSNAMAEEESGIEGRKIGRVSVDIYSRMNTQVSLGLYFMGYGLSYSQDISKGFKKDLSFTMYSSPVGGEFRYHKTDRIHGKLVAKSLDIKFNLEEGEAKMENFIVNAYYVFNPKKFSYSSAMSYSKIQKRSAGSLLGGFTFNQTRISSYDPIVRTLMGNVNKIFLRQYSIGAGYGYNWVPVKGLTIHASAIPMLLITTKSATKSTPEDWEENQKAVQRKLFGKKTHISYNHIARASLSYSLKDRYLVGVSAFYNYFRVGKHSAYYASTEDWNMRFFVAYRF